MRDYGKVFCSFWSSGDMRKLSEDARTLALYLLSCPHGTIAGVFRLPDGYACEDLQWASERVAKGFSELFKNGFANRCETTKWVFLTKHFEWNKPENPNQWKAARKLAEQVPKECTWRVEFERVFAKESGNFLPPKPNPSETLPEPYRNQEQEQEQEQEQDLTALSESVDSSSDRCPVAKIIERFRLRAPSLVQPRIIPDSTKSAIAARWRQSPKHQSLEFWEDFFQYCEKLPLLTGNVPSRSGGSPFRADLGWVVKAENFAKIVNGNYDQGDRA
jgi:hypothetical protein